MSETRSHVNYVHEWLKREANGCGTEQLVELLELAMIALWNRANLTLGEATLRAIVDRVVYSASEQFPPFESLKVAAAGIDFREMRGQTANFNDSELTDGIRFIVTEFLVVIGNLTAEIPPVCDSKNLLPDPTASGLGQTSTEENRATLVARDRIGSEVSVPHINKNRMREMVSDAELFFSDEEFDHLRGCADCYIAWAETVRQFNESQSHKEDTGG